MQSKILTCMVNKWMTHHILLYRLGRLACSASKTFCASHSRCDKYAHRHHKQVALRVHKRVDKCKLLCHNDRYHILGWVRTEDSHMGLHLVHTNRKHSKVGNKFMYYIHNKIGRYLVKMKEKRRKHFPGT